MRKVIGVLFSLLILVSFCFNKAFAREIYEAKPERKPQYKTDSVVVRYKRNLNSTQIEKLNKRFNTHFTKKRDYADFVTLRVPESVEVNEFIEKLKMDSDVEYAEPNYIAYTQMVPNDTYYKYQWNFDNLLYGGINAEKAWDISSGERVVVAIVDTGIAYENYRQNWWNRYEIAPDLIGTCFVDGYDFVNSDSHPNDDDGHGTHIAGTVAQATNNQKGVSGLAYKACLMPVKVLGSSGSGTYADIAEGIRYAADNGAKVINLSLGGTVSANSLEDAVSYAHNKGVVIVASAGNGGTSSLKYPAAYDDYVIAVGATRFDETLAPYSNYGPSLDIVAPGGDLNVDQNNDGYKDGILQQTFDRHPRDWGYWFYQGTSMASPHAAAVAAMIISNGTTGPNTVRDILESSAEDLGDVGRDDTFGWGLIDAAAALGVDPGTIPDPTSTPTPSFEPTPTPTPKATPTSTPTPVPTATPTPTQTPTPTPIDSPSPTPTPNPIKPWWCRWLPYHYLCR